MKADEAEIVVVGGQDYVETQDGVFATGLQLPACRTMIYPSLATATPLLDRQAIREIVESPDFKFGREWFSDSWLTNQNGYGSCASYAASSALSKARYLGGQDRVDLSGDYLYSLVNGGRDRGSMLDENMQAIMNRGVCSRDTVGLGGIYRSKYNTSKADREALRFRAHECYAIPDEASMATALALKMPVVHAIHVGRNWRRLDGDVLIGDQGVGNHSEHCDDIRYNRRKGRFEFRNGSSHNRPYFWVHWGHFQKTSRYHQFYAVPRAIDDPKGDNPDFGRRDDSQDDQPLSTPRLVMQLSGSCGPCINWKRNELPKVEAAGYAISEGSVGSKYVPAFRLEVDGKNEAKTGYWPFQDIERRVAELRS